MWEGTSCCSDIRSTPFCASATQTHTVRSLQHRPSQPLSCTASLHCVRHKGSHLQRHPATSLRGMRQSPHSTKACGRSHDGNRLTIMLDEVALAHEHGVHVQAGSYVLNEVLSEHGGLDLSGAPHSSVGRPVALAQVQVEVELGEGVRLHMHT